ncbi:hypothetical protein [Nocardia stercoris]|uniref:Uncharacterized protein n=1 Tax=Nocardia stercoris TaxID=2483361 RepID=A0A3M2L727_9NOCA|nr:hypothetical protein [Nocardia stercoris]RMI30338.1 hypothetical protein EBN03_22080 [Nocardia stercoris]
MKYPGDVVRVPCKYPASARRPAPRPGAGNEAAAMVRSGIAAVVMSGTAAVVMSGAVAVVMSGTAAVVA